MGLRLRRLTYLLTLPNLSTEHRAGTILGPGRGQNGADAVFGSGGLLRRTLLSP